MTILGGLAGIALIIGQVPVLVRIRFSGLSNVAITDVWPSASGVFFGGSTLLAVLVKAPILDHAKQVVGDRYLILGMLFLTAYVIVATGIALSIHRSQSRSFVSMVCDATARLNPVFVLGLAGVVWLVRFYLASQFGLHYSGSATAERIATLPYELSVLWSLSTTVSSVLPVWALIAARGHRNALVRVVAAGLLAGELLYGFISGRRAIAYLILLLLWIHFALSQRITLRHWLVGLAGIASIVITAPIFERARFVASMNLEPGSRDLVEFLEAVSDPDDAQVRGVPIRYADRAALYVVWTAEIARAERREDLLGGEVLAKGLGYAIPTAVLPEKRSWRWGESLINDHYAIPRGDSPNSVAVAGLADFGFAGMLIYGLAFGLVLILSVRIGARLLRSSPFASLLVMLAALQAAVLVEHTVVALGAEARNIIMLSMLAVAWRLIPRSRALPYGEVGQMDRLTEE